MTGIKIKRLMCGIIAAPDKNYKLLKWDCVPIIVAEHLIVGHVRQQFGQKELLPRFLYEQWVSEKC